MTEKMGRCAILGRFAAGAMLAAATGCAPDGSSTLTPNGTAAQRVLNGTPHTSGTSPVAALRRRNPLLTCTKRLSPLWTTEEDKARWLALMEECLKPCKCLPGRVDCQRQCWLEPPCEEAETRQPVQLGAWATHCSGTFIDSDLVLTAAHCVVERPMAGGSPPIVDGRAPGVDLTTLAPERLQVCLAVDAEAGQCSDEDWHDVSRVMIHPGYEGFLDTARDWALLSLTAEVTSSRLQWAELPDSLDGFVPPEMRIQSAQRNSSFATQRIEPSTGVFTPMTSSLDVAEFELRADFYAQEGERGCPTPTAGVGQEEGDSGSGWFDREDAVSGVVLAVLSRGLADGIIDHRSTAFVSSTSYWLSPLIAYSERRHQNAICYPAEVPDDPGYTVVTGTVCLTGDSPGEWKLEYFDSVGTYLGSSGALSELFGAELVRAFGISWTRAFEPLAEVWDFVFSAVTGSETAQTLMVIDSSAGLLATLPLVEGLAPPGSNPAGWEVQLHGVQMDGDADPEYVLDVDGKLSAFELDGGQLVPKAGVSGVFRIDSNGDSLDDFVVVEACANPDEGRTRQVRGGADSNPPTSCVPGMGPQAEYGPLDVLTGPFGQPLAVGGEEQPAFVLMASGNVAYRVLTADGLDQGSWKWLWNAPTSTSVQALGLTPSVDEDGRTRGIEISLDDGTSRFAAFDSSVSGPDAASVELGSCASSVGGLACGAQAPDGTCWCDDGCAGFGDCCWDASFRCDDQDGSELAAATAAVPGGPSTGVGNHLAPVASITTLSGTGLGVFIDRDWVLTVTSLVTWLDGTEDVSVEYHGTNVPIDSIQRHPALPLVLMRVAAGSSLEIPEDHRVALYSGTDAELANERVLLDAAATSGLWDDRWSENGSLALFGDEGDGLRTLSFEPAAWSRMGAVSGLADSVVAVPSDGANGIRAIGAPVLTWNGALVGLTVALEDVQATIREADGTPSDVSATLFWQLSLMDPPLGAPGPEVSAARWIAQVRGGALRKDGNGDGYEDLWGYALEDPINRLVMVPMVGTVATGAPEYVGASPTGGDWELTARGVMGPGMIGEFWREPSYGGVYIRVVTGEVSPFALLFLLDPEWEIAAVADLDGDHVDDLLLRSELYDSYYFWLMEPFDSFDPDTAQHEFSTAIRYGQWFDGPATGGQEVLAAGPFAAGAAADGGDEAAADLLWRDPSTGAVTLWAMTMHRRACTSDDDPRLQESCEAYATDELLTYDLVYSVGLPAMPTYFSPAGVADFDGDGAVDLGWHASGAEAPVGEAGEVRLWLGDGLGGFSELDVLDTDGSPLVVDPGTYVLGG